MKTFFLFLFINSNLLYATVVTFCYEDRNFPPYIFSGPKGEQPKGLMLDLILLSAKDAGITVNLISKPWLRCQKLVKQNQANALFAMIQTPERSLVFAFPKSLNAKQAYLFQGQYAIFVKKNGPFDLDDTHHKLVNENGLNLDVYYPLAKYGLSAPLGYVVRQILEDKNVLSSLNLTPIQALKFVANGKLDGFVIDRQIGLFLSKELKLDHKLTATKHSLLQTKWHAVFNKAFYQTNQKQIDLFWNAFEKYRSPLINK
jgi:polar amino acid transport system substrate-binding protein